MKRSTARHPSHHPSGKEANDTKMRPEADDVARDRILLDRQNLFLRHIDPHWRAEIERRPVSCYPALVDIRLEMAAQIDSAYRRLTVTPRPPASAAGSALRVAQVSEGIVRSNRE